MALRTYNRAPFPWFGGKRLAASAVWQALGDVPHYVEPFAGSLAVLLERPHPANRMGMSETVNDIDGMLCNFWRAIQFSPEETAHAASWPVCELDKHARSVTLLQWRESEATAHLAGDATWHDPVMAGWWAWSVANQIGGWGLGGPWWPDGEGKLRKRKRLTKKDAELYGTTYAQGVRGEFPHLSADGQGVVHHGTREPGLGAPGIPASVNSVSDDGRGVNHHALREEGLGADTDEEPEFEYHKMTMPEIVRWFAYLSARLRHVRVINGDWSRVVTTGVAHTLSVRRGLGPAGVFLDPPYGDVGRVSVYGKHEDFSVAEKVREWAAGVGDDPKWRIVYAGFDEEGESLEAVGWEAVEWFRGGFLRGGMGNTNRSGKKNQQHRERLWLSPHCLKD